MPRKQTLKVFIADALHMHWELDYLVGQTTKSIKLLYNPFIAPPGSGRDTHTHTPLTQAHTQRDTGSERERE